MILQISSQTHPWPPSPRGPNPSNHQLRPDPKCRLMIEWLKTSSQPHPWPPSPRGPSSSALDPSSGQFQQVDEDNDFYPTINRFFTLSNRDWVYNVVMHKQTISKWSPAFNLSTISKISDLKQNTLHAIETKKQWQFFVQTRQQGQLTLRSNQQSTLGRLRS